VNRTLVVEPPYSLLMLEDVVGGTPPESFEGAMFAATRSCLIFGCQATVDGPTTVELMTDVGGRRSLLSARYETVLETPSRAVALRSAELKTYAEILVASDATRVSIFSDSYEHPSHIQILLEERGVINS
jgi:hypothetical protein